MSKHSPEPWTVYAPGGYPTSIYHGDRETLATIDEDHDCTQDLTAANARRIVACVNACAGIPTELLEPIGLATHDPESAMGSHRLILLGRAAYEFSGFLKPTPPKAD